MKKLNMRLPDHLIKKIEVEATHASDPEGGRRSRLAESTDCGAKTVYARESKNNAHPIGSAHDLPRDLSARKKERLLPKGNGVAK